MRGLGGGLDVPAAPGLGVPELPAGEGKHVEVRGAQLPVQLLQGQVVHLRLLAETRHVYNQRRLDTEGTARKSLVIGQIGKLCCKTPLTVVNQDTVCSDQP